jgi:hypothetical protein
MFVFIWISIRSMLIVDLGNLRLSLKKTRINLYYLLSKQE